MTELETRLNKLSKKLEKKRGVGKTLSNVKRGLKSSSHFVDSVKNFGDNLGNNLGNNLEEIGGIAGAIGGWAVGKTVKLAGGLACGIASGTIKTVADTIPDASDLKLPETDKKIAFCIDTCPLPSNEAELIELLQFISGTLKSKNSPYGKTAISSFKELHAKVYSEIVQVVKPDKKTLEYIKPYAPKKQFGVF